MLFLCQRIPGIRLYRLSFSSPRTTGRLPIWLGVPASGAMISGIYREYGAQVKLAVIVISPFIVTSMGLVEPLASTLQ